MARRKEGYPEIDISKEVRQMPVAGKMEVGYGSCPRCGKKGSFIGNRYLNPSFLHFFRDHNIS